MSKGILAEMGNDLQTLLLNVPVYPLHFHFDNSTLGRECASAYLSLDWPVFVGAMQVTRKLTR
jgi:hypothetical protein